VWHIHNGDIAVAAARRTAIPGEHVAFRETLATGPVPAHDRLEHRARFLSEAYDQNLLKTRTELLEHEAAFDAAEKHDEIVLWFEHDLFCLMNFVYVLTRLARHPRVSAIWSDQPIGTMEPEELARRFESRAAVLPAMFAIAADVWKAYTASDPSGLQRFIDRDTRDFPFLREGMTLHASRFPSLANGLGEIENRALRLVASGAGDFASLFGRFNEEVPRFGFGDGEVMRLLWHLANVAVPVLTLTRAEGEGPPSKALIAITPAGTNILEGKVDYLDVNPPDIWFGGVHLTRENVWRWDEEKRRLTKSHSTVS
jgi:hypothetical protein